MQHVTVWGRELDLQGSPLTLLAYRKEFDGDLSEAITNLFRSDSEILVEPMLRIVWAMAKTADSDTSPYEEWLDEFPDGEFDVLNPPLEVIISAFNAELFRTRKTSFIERVKERLARLLERVAKRLRA